MKVYFSDFPSASSQVIWKVNEQTNTARCCYRFLNTSEADKNSLNSELTGIDGIHFNTDAIACISDYESFCSTHHALAVKAESLLKKTSLSFFSDSVTATHQQALSVPMAAFQKSSSKKIKADHFDRLMQKQAGSIMCYNRLFQSSGLKLKTSLSQQLVSETRLMIIMDMYKDQLLYQLRSEQVDKMRELIDDYLLPKIHILFNAKETFLIPEQLASFLQEAVHVALRNDQNNIQATEYEKQEEDIPRIKSTWLDLAIAERKRRSEGKILFLDYFHDSKINAQAFTTDTDLTAWLEGIREALSQDEKQAVSDLLDELKQLIVEVGLLKHLNDHVDTGQFLKSGGYFKERVKLTDFSESINAQRSCELAQKVFTRTSRYGDLGREDAHALPVYHSLSALIKSSCMKQNFKKDTRQVQQLTQALFRTLRDHLFKFSCKNTSDAKNSLADTTINRDTLDIYLAEPAYDHLVQQLADFSPKRFHHQKHFEKYLVEKVTDLYEQLLKGQEFKTDPHAASAYSL